MFVVFDENGLGARASLDRSTTPGDKSFEIARELYLEIQANPFVLRELAMTTRNGVTMVERVTTIIRLNQTMQPIPKGKHGDVILAIRWYGMQLEYAPHIKKVGTHEFTFCIDTPLQALCDPVKLSHGTIVQMEHILPEDKLQMRAEWFRRASVFVSRPYHNFTYSYYLDGLMDF